MGRPAPKPRGLRSKLIERLPEALPKAQVPSEPVIPEAAADHGHAIFGRAPVVAVAVEQIRYRGRTVVTVDRGRFSPRDLCDQTAVREMVGVGRFKLKALGANGRSCLVPVEMDCPDENGGLDLVSPMPDDWPTGAPAPGVAPIAAPNVLASLEGIINALREQQRFQKDQLDSELARAEQRRQADMSSMSGFNAQLVDLVKLGSGRANGESNAQLEWVKETNTRLEKENRELRAELLSLKETHLKLRLGHESSSDAFFKVAVETYAPKVLELGAQFMADKRKEKTGATLAAAALASDLPDVKVPSAAELVAQLGAGGTIPAEWLKVYAKLRQAGALSSELWAIVEPLISVASAAV